MNKYEQMEKSAEWVPGTEEVNRAVNMLATREESRSYADALFGPVAKASRKELASDLRKLFLQAPATAIAAPDAELPEEKEGTLKAVPGSLGGHRLETMSEFLPG